jgi:hypothetical protein
MDQQIGVELRGSNERQIYGDVLVRYEKEEPKPDPDGFDKDKDDACRSLWSSYLDDLGRMGSRHETARAFYLTVLTAVWAFFGLAEEKKQLVQMSNTVFNVTGLVGLAICVAWLRQMWSFHVIFIAKKATLRELEKKLSTTLQPFTVEDSMIAGGKWKYHSGTLIDTVVAGIFAILFLTILFHKQFGA